MDVEGAELQAASHHTLTLTSSTSVTSASVSSSCVRVWVEDGDQEAAHHLTMAPQGDTPSCTPRWVPS